MSSSNYHDQIVLGSKSSDLDPNDTQATAEDAALCKRFKISHLIGSGNYARVYRATSQNGKDVAVKAINMSQASDNYKKKFLPRELTIMKKLNHVNICKIHEILQISDRIYIIMQFCSKGTIADLLHAIGPLGEPVTRYIFNQVIEAVSYMHSIDVAHRDLKVENILLDEDCVPKLTDFSYSVYTTDRHSFNRNVMRQSSSSTAKQLVSLATGNHKKNRNSKSLHRLNDTFCGTLPYLPPEMIRQYPYDAKKTDIWALGICLFVMINDRMPFPFNDVKEMLKRQLAKDYRFRANIKVGDSFKDLLSGMLEPDYAKRPSSSCLTKHAWLTGPCEKPPI